MNQFPPAPEYPIRTVSNFFENLRSRQWCTLSCEYLREFSKKFETAVMVYSGAWWKLIHEKTRSRKSREIVTLRRVELF
jgi:hypothetical protein